ncbi:MAG: hypothetical protein KDD63_15840 [Bacteroidetes bacterium]|nr:hypothetical protein [Bacteroidota bacterium]
MKTVFIKILFLSGWVIFPQLGFSQQVSLPAFSFYDLDGNTVTNESLDNARSTLIMLFDPYCDHCDQQAEWIAAAAGDFKEIQLVFVTIEPEIEPIKDFQKRHFGESSLKHVIFLQDKDFVFETYFGYTDDAINIYCYKPGQKLPKYFGKEQEAEKLLKFL